METSNSRIEQSIKEQIRHLHDIFNKGRSLDDRVKKLRDYLALLDSRNQEHVKKMLSVNEAGKMLMYLLACGGCMLLDFAIIFNAVALLCKNAFIVATLRILLPLGLVGIEIGLSHVAAMSTNAGEYLSWLNRNLKFFVIAALVTFSTLTVVYTIEGYNPSVDGGSLAGHVIATTITQIMLLLIASILHVWIINHAEDIFNTFSGLWFMLKRNGIAKKLRRLERKYKKWESNFSMSTCNVVQQVEMYERGYGVPASYFAKGMPRDLINAINMVMGRIVFNPNDSRDTKSDIYER